MKDTLNQISKLFSIELSDHQQGYPFFVATISNKNIYANKEVSKEVIETIKQILVTLSSDAVSASLFEKVLKGEGNAIALDERYNEKSWVLVQLPYSKSLYDLIVQIIIPPYELAVFSSHCYLLIQSKDYMEVLEGLVSMIESELMLKIQLYYSDPIVDLKEIYQQKQSLNRLEKIAHNYSIYTPLVHRKMMLFPLLVESMPEEIYDTNLEYFTPKQYELLQEEETIKTIKTFLANNLSVAETSRKLYIHRNTLIYRLDKYKSALGLDIRLFEDAMKLAFYLFLTKQ